MKHLSIWLLAFAEWLYLRAHGWRLVKDPLSGHHYTPPADYPFKIKAWYVKGHAVNAQKQVKNS